MYDEDEDDEELAEYMDIRGSALHPLDIPIRVVTFACNILRCASLLFEEVANDLMAHANYQRRRKGAFQETLREIESLPVTEGE